MDSSVLYGYLSACALGGLFFMIGVGILLNFKKKTKKCKYRLLSV